MGFNVPLPPHLDLLPPVPESRVKILRRRIVKFLLPKVKWTTSNVSEIPEIVHDVLHSPLLQIVLGLVLFVLAYARAVSVAVAIAIFVAWFVAIFGIARSGRIKRLKAPTRLVTILMCALFLMIPAIPFARWAIRQVQGAKGTFPPQVQQPTGGQHETGKENTPLESKIGRHNSTELPNNHIDESHTAKQQALQLSADMWKWLKGERPKYATFEDYLAAIYQEYPSKFEKPAQDMYRKLRNCGADTKGLGKDLENTHSTFPSITYFEGIAFDLQDAAYDIPGGRPDCGTKARSGTGFSEKETGLYTIAFGSAAIGYTEDQLRNHVSFGQNMTAYLGQGKFYLDVVLSDDFGRSVVKVVKNEVDRHGEPSWDMQHTDRVLEVVDDHQIPRLQLIYESEHQIRVNGVFVDRESNQIVVMAPNTPVQRLAIVKENLPVKVPLKPLFKYPSWKYPYQYVNP